MSYGTKNFRAEAARLSEEAQLAMLDYDSVPVHHQNFLIKTDFLAVQKAISVRKDFLREHVNIVRDVWTQFPESSSLALAFIYNHYGSWAKTFAFLPWMDEISESEVEIIFNSPEFDGEAWINFVSHSNRDYRHFPKWLTDALARTVGLVSLDDVKNCILFWPNTEAICHFTTDEEVLKYFILNDSFGQVLVSPNVGVVEDEVAKLVKDVCLRFATHNGHCATSTDAGSHGRGALALTYGIRHGLLNVDEVSNLLKSCDYYRGFLVRSRRTLTKSRKDALERWDSRLEDEIMKELVGAAVGSLPEEYMSQLITVYAEGL